MRGLLVLASALLVLAPGCGGGDERAETPATVPTTAGSAVAPPTTPTVVTPTAPAVTTAPTTVAAVCPPVEVPGDATDVTTAEGDFDGDGRADELRGFRAGGAWHLQVELAAGGGDDVAVTPDGPAAVEAIGGFDVNEDGDDEAWARVGSGAYASIFGLFVLQSCELTEVVRGGLPARFPVGASVGNGVGVECAGAGSGDVDLSVFEGTSGDGVTYMVVSTLLHLDDGSLVELTTDVFSTTEADEVFRLDCGSLGP